MKILIVVMGILSLFSSCTNRKVKLTEEVDSVQNGFEVKENKSRLDNDTLPSNMFSSNKGNDTIGVCTKRFDIAAFERHKKDYENSTYVGYTEIVANDTLINYIKDSTNYFQLWDDMLENKIFPTSFEWWGINISFGFMLICLIGIKIFLYRKSNKHKEGKTIQVKSYSNLSLNSAEQIISSIIPWLTIFADKLDFMVLFVCIILQCCFIAIASYNNNNYNLLCSIWGYRYYEVYTEENTYILISGKCIRNKNEIKKFIEVTDYMGLIINEK